VVEEVGKHYKSVNLELLRRDEVNHFKNDDEYVTYPFPKEVGTGSGNMLKTTHDISVYRGEHYYNTEHDNQTFDLGFISCEFDEEVLMVDFATGGAIEMQNRDSSEVFNYGINSTLFRRLTTFDANFKHEMAEYLETVTFSIPVTSLRLIIGEQNTKLVFSALKLTSPSSTIIHSLPLRINRILQQAISPHLQGSMKKLYAQTKVLEYLCEIVEYIEKNNGALTVNDKQVLAVKETHRYLCQLDGKTPSLVDLATEANMSAQVLSSLFKKEFGVTIHRFISRKRLNDAHDAILETSIPLKVLANNIGFSHVNHFITAFKREFSYSPGSLRKK